MNYDKLASEIETMQEAEHDLLELTRAMARSLQKMNERISRINERLTLLEARLEEDTRGDA